jgi:CDP-diacylglycerol--glycerol-3-phosphate 3-phosphatidyltransferase
VIEKCAVGLLERAERIALLAVGSLFDVMAPILWILAALTHFTVVQRIHYTSIPRRWTAIGHVSC